MAPPSILLARAIASSLSYKTIITISTAGGGVVLMTIILLIILLYRAVSKHRRLLADLEHRGIDFCGPNMSEASTDPARQLSALRRSSFVPSGVSAGWSTLDSQESISVELPNRPVQANDAESQRWRASSGRISWPFSRSQKAENNVLLSEISAPNLPAIMESPRASDFGSVCASTAEDHVGNQKAISSQNQKQPNAVDHVHKPISEFEEKLCAQPPGHATAAASSDSLTPKPLFSTSDVRQSTIEVSKRRNRAKTVGAIRLVQPDSINSGLQLYRSRLHARSLSLGSQNPGSAPSRPVPPLPLSFASKGDGSSSRSWAQEWPTSRLSGSSLESVGSSLLITSPKIKRSHSDRFKEGPKRDWSNSLVAGPRPLPHYMSLRKSIVSLGRTHEFDKCKGADYISAPEGQFESSEKVVNAVHQASNNHSSVRHIDTAERLRLSSPRTAQVLRTPRRSSRLSIAPNGSPNNRKASVRHDMSSVQSIPSRQTSQASTRASSTRSSNGNPFQWDSSPMQSGKPSALKGSPSSRKGHRRHNSVRISLSPTVINTHRPSPSPSMVSIQEELPEPSSQVEKPATGLGFSNTRALPRPPTSSTFAPEVKLNPTTLRASLTPNSPTLSLISYTQGPSSGEFSDSNWSFTASPSKLHHQGDSNSSMLIIPTLPSPGKATTDPIIPTPTFSFSRPSSEFDEECNPPPEFRLLAQPVTPSCSSFPENLQTTNLVRSSRPSETDLTLSQLHADQLEPSHEHSNIVQNEQEPINVDPLELLPKRPLAGTGTRQNNIECPVDSPPCSPKSQPNRKNTNPEAELVANLVEVTQYTIHTEVIATTGAEVTETGENGGQVPSLTLTTKRTATPPRTSFSSHEVPSSPLKYSISQLRRMNSDASQDSLGARRYLKLGREASMPALDVDTMLAGGRCRWDSWIRILRETSEEDAERAGDTEEVVELDERSQNEEVYGEMQRREDLEELREGVAQEDLGSRLPMANLSGNRARVEHLKITQLPSRKESNKGQETPVVKLQPPSSYASPGSLYDENGFLRC